MREKSPTDTLGWDRAEKKEAEAITMKRVILFYVSDLK